MPVFGSRAPVLFGWKATVWAGERLCWSVGERPCFMESACIWLESARFDERVPTFFLRVPVFDWRVPVFGWKVPVFDREFRSRRAPLVERAGTVRLRTG